MPPDIPEAHQGRLGGFFTPFHYARSRDRYRPPPDLYRRLNRRIGPWVTSLGLSPRDVITLEVQGRWDRHADSKAMAKEARYYFGISADASLEEIQGVAEHYPVFRIEYEGRGDTRRGWGK